MPTTTPALKVDAVRALGARWFCTATAIPTPTATPSACSKSRADFVHPFDDPDVIAGQGTIAMEILRQLQNSAAPGSMPCLSPSAGGGLISGVANYIKAVRPEIKVIGVQMNDSDAMIQSVQAGGRVQPPMWACFRMARR